MNLAGLWINSDGRTVFGGGHASGLMGKNRRLILMLAEPVVKGVDGGDDGGVAVVCAVHLIGGKRVWIRLLNLFIYLGTDCYYYCLVVFIGFKVLKRVWE